MRTRTVSIQTGAREEIRIITDLVDRTLEELGAREGLLNLYVEHTTCGLTINENADPDVLTDLIAAYRALVPAIPFRHAEGNSDAHFLASLIGATVTIPVLDGKLALGRWQGIYLVELDGPRKRRVRATYLD